MKKIKNTLIIALSLVLFLPAFTVLAKADQNSMYTNTINYLANKTQNNDASVGSVGGEWWVLTLARSGANTKNGFFCRYKKTVEDYITANINQNEQLSSTRSTENSRVILALVAAGIDPRNIAGHNLIKGLSSFSFIENQGLNAAIYALLAIDSYNFELYQNPQDANDTTTREKLINTILRGFSGGGWSYFEGGAPDVDITCMALEALAPYYLKNQDVTKVVDEALENLSIMQDASGGFESFGSVNCSSTAEALLALTALNINPLTDSRFIKNNNTIVDALEMFTSSSGTFKYLDNTTPDDMTTEQAAYALVALNRFLNGKTFLYNMTDTDFTIGTHYWDNGQIIIAPTATTLGQKTYTCTACGAKRYETLEKLPTESKKENTQNNTEIEKSPNTKDNYYIYFIFMGCSAAGAVILTLISKKRVF